MSLSYDESINSAAGGLTKDPVKKANLQQQSGKRIRNKYSGGKYASNFGDWTSGPGTVNDTMMTGKNAAPKKVSFWTRLGNEWNDIPSGDYG